MYLDPYLTDSDGGRGRLQRSFAPPLRPDEITDASVILLTHDHVDHTDPQTLLPLAEASPRMRLVAPFTSRDRLVGAGLAEGRVEVPRVGEPISVAGATITAVPSAHTDVDHDPTKGAQGYPYVGYVIEWNDVTVYHAGDTVVYDGLLEKLSAWELDVVFLPINGRDYFRERRGIVGNMDFREAAHLAEELDVGLIVPTHFDLFEFNGEDPGHFVSYLRSLNPARRHKVLCPGETLYFVKEQ